MADYSDILIKPVITEKSTALQEDLGRYTFVVDRRANKIQIKKAVESMYGVTVEQIKTMVRPGKSKIRYTTTGVSKGKTGAQKRAVVKLVEGDEIDFFSNI